jgi:hypothetical protein
MGQEISVSYQAVKSKVYRLIDALVEDEKSPEEIHECIRRWWALIHPSDRPVAHKYLSLVLARSNTSLVSIQQAMNEARDFDALREVGSERLSRMAAAPSHAQLTNTLS